jgi:predicted amidohydrolase YtcJ
MLEPYEKAAEKGPNYRGEFLWDMDVLKKAFALINKEGYQIHVHSIGDAATKNTLDALEYAHTQVPGDFRPAITHVQVVAPEDFARFKKLGVIASVQTGFWGFKEPYWWEVVDHAFLGERAEHEYPLKSFFKAGVVVISSSDHAVMPIPNPLWAIRAGVTRNLNHAAYYGIDDITDMDDPKWLLNKNERASLDEMIRSYTINSAYAHFLENESGSIEVGKSADMVIISKDITKLDPIKIDSAEILKTIFRGEVVFEAEE